jgi:hypothetical protein
MDLKPINKDKTKERIKFLTNEDLAFIRDEISDEIRKRRNPNAGKGRYKGERSRGRSGGFGGFGIEKSSFGSGMLGHVDVDEYGEGY